MVNNGRLITTSISPWLPVSNAQIAVDFYKRAFGALEVYRLETPDGGLVSRLSVDGAEFWLSSESEKKINKTNQLPGGDSIRMILIVADPDLLFKQALAAGAALIFPIGEDHGWRLGRLADPFGLHWEIGYQIADR
jgi:PhnB protein